MERRTRQGRLVLVLGGQGVATVSPRLSSVPLQTLTLPRHSPSKPSTPSRAYLHVTRRDDLTALSQKVQSSTWEDAKETYNDPALISAPTVEFAIYKKIPSEKKRVDPRQGTIDQDPEFMAFLEALAN